jgi:hypothetical protein
MTTPKRKLYQFDLEGSLLLRFEAAFANSGFQSRTEFLRYIIINHCDDKGFI